MKIVIFSFILIYRRHTLFGSGAIVEQLEYVLLLKRTKFSPTPIWQLVTPCMEFQLQKVQSWT